MLRAFGWLKGKKTLRVGVTESAVISMMHYRDRLPNTPKQSVKLWFMWNAIGFYDTDFSKDVSDKHGMNIDEYLTDGAQRFFKRYKQACKGSNRLVHLEISRNDAEEFSNGSENALDEVFRFAGVGANSVFDSFRYSWVQQACLGKSVVVVSPFAPLMKQQFDEGNLGKLRPEFQPKEMHFYRFPYCFFNNGPHANSFETIDAVYSDLLHTAGRDVVYLFSCGSMGVILSDLLSRRCAETFYCGGALQLFFGIHGARWKESALDTALYPGDALLESYSPQSPIWIDKVPDDYVPLNSKLIEKGCYW